MTPEEREVLRKKLGVTERTLRGYEKHVRRGAQVAHDASFKLGSLLVDPVWGHTWLVIAIWAAVEDEDGAFPPEVTVAPSVVPTRKMLADMRGANAREYRAAGCLLHEADPLLLFIPRLSPTIPIAFARYWKVGALVQSRFTERAGDYLERAIYKEHLVRPLPRAVTRTALVRDSEFMEFNAYMWATRFGEGDVSAAEYESYVVLIQNLEAMD